MRRSFLAVLCAVLWACASTDVVRHPTLEHPLHGCYIGCPFGYSLFGSFRQQQLNCNGTTRYLTDVTITGEDDAPGSPDESRWFTGYLNAAAEGMILKRLAARGVNKASAEWAHEYGLEEQRMRSEYGDSVRAAYPKKHVALQSCDTFRRSQCMASGNCAALPGEPDPVTGRPAPIPPQH